MNARLKVEGIRSGYGEIQVLRGIEMLCGEAQITALVGSNGAGKSTLLRTLAGILPTATGRILHGEAEIQRLPSHERVARGIIMVPEGRLVFPDLSVEENLRTGAVNVRARDVWSKTVKEVYDLFPRLLERQKQLAGTLSGGEQQMLALGRGLMGLPEVLLLDEPTLGLAPSVATQIFNIIPQLTESNISILIAEQDLNRVLDIAHFGYVIENGRITMQDTGSALRNNPAVAEAYLG
ncbi:MAG: ABC transporter ATP-binding protein [Proteobacteria bacterium TMED51]|nr:MAG: ABC transporter ATP-binding protein [Proteobacteria bacterium TMED51]HBP84125.1 ABC transporter ATP-binding protein [Gammaproteobacteria bacterium]|tara:strand:+ start:1156 stop:1866 length:711 start_codon:yes stop_codon:yes gene_type:complete